MLVTSNSIYVSSDSQSKPLQSSRSSQTKTTTRDTLTLIVVIWNKAWICLTPAAAHILQPKITEDLKLDDFKKINNQDQAYLIWNDREGKRRLRSLATLIESWAGTPYKTTFISVSNKNNLLTNLFIELFPKKQRKLKKISIVGALDSRSLQSRWIEEKLILMQGLNVPEEIFRNVFQNQQQKLAEINKENIDVTTLSINSANQNIVKSNKTTVSSKQEKIKAPQNLFTFILAEDFIGIENKKIIFSHNDQFLVIKFQENVYLNMMNNLLKSYSFLEIEVTGNFLKISGVDKSKISISQLEKLKKQYVRNVKASLNPPPLITLTPTPTQPKKEQVLFVSQDEFPKKEKRYVEKKPSKKELLGQEITSKLLEKQAARKIRRTKKRRPRQSLSLNLPTENRALEVSNPTSLPVFTILETTSSTYCYCPIADELDAQEIDELIAKRDRQDMVALPQKSEETAIDKTTTKETCPFKEGQIERLQAAIHALKNIKVIVRALQAKSFTFAEDDHFSQAQKKSLAYHLLKFCEALAPTSRNRDDERDATFFEMLNQFFLSEAEIRLIRNMIRGSFFLIQGHELYHLAQTLVENKILDQLFFLKDKNSIPKTSKKVIDRSIFSLSHNFENELKPLSENQRNIKLLIAIKHEIEFITACIKSAEDVRTFNTYLAAIKKTLSDISKLSSFLTVKCEFFLKTEEMKRIIPLGNTIAHEFGDEIDSDQMTDEIDISEIWRLFQPDSPFLKKLQENLNRTRLVVVA